MLGLFIFGARLKMNIMPFEFDQYLGFIAFAIVGLMGFWLMVFLLAILPYWVGGNIKEMLDERKAAKKEEEGTV